MSLAPSRSDLLASYTPSNRAEITAVPALSNLLALPYTGKRTGNNADPLRTYSSPVCTRKQWTNLSRTRFKWTFCCSCRRKAESQKQRRFIEPRRAPPFQDTRQENASNAAALKTDSSCICALKQLTKAADDRSKLNCFCLYRRKK